MLVVTSDCYRQMIAHLQTVFPLEGCGFLSGSGSVATTVHPVRNELASSSAFRMDPNEQLAALLDIDATGDTVAAVFHSHPGAAPYFSEADIVGTRFWPGVHLVVGLEFDPQTGRFVAETAGFIVEQGQITDCKLEIV